MLMQQLIDGYIQKKGLGQAKTTTKTAAACTAQGTSSEEGFLGGESAAEEDLDEYRRQVRGSR